MSDLSDVQTLMQAAAGMGGAARLWVEERLVRGTPSGGIAGAHVIFGVELTDPMGGKTRTTKGPYVLDLSQVLSGQPAADWATVANIVEQQYAHTVAERDATIATLTADKTALTTTTTEQAATIATLTQQVATLTAQLAAASAASADTAAVDDPANSPLTEAPTE